MVLRPVPDPRVVTRDGVALFLFPSPSPLSRSTVNTRTRGAMGRISSQSIVRGTETGPKIVRRDSESPSKLFHCAVLRPTVPGEHHRNRRLTDSDRCRQFNLVDPLRLHVAVEAVRKGLSSRSIRSETSPPGSSAWSRHPRRPDWFDSAERTRRPREPRGQTDLEFLVEKILRASGSESLGVGPD